MFGISFSELLLIGVIALIVLGPERLPRVARTAGHLLGRAQRYINDVKSDIEREINLNEVNSLKKQFQEASDSVKQSVSKAVEDVRTPLDEARQAVNTTTEELKKPFVDIQDSVTKVSEQVKDPLAEARKAVSELSSSITKLPDGDTPSPENQLAVPNVPADTAQQATSTAAPEPITGAAPSVSDDTTSQAITQAAPQQPASEPMDTTRSSLASAHSQHKAKATSQSAAAPSDAAVSAPTTPVRPATSSPDTDDHKGTEP